MTNKTILITGSSGFIGRNISKALTKKGYEIITAEITDGFDLTDWEQVEKIERFDIAIHLAAISYVPLSYKIPRKSNKFIQLRSMIRNV